jgi:nucleoside-diphosphate-sugar epimerase
MRVLITGCAGFIGSNLFRRCLDEGLDVQGVDDLSNGHVEFLPKNSGTSLIQGCFASNSVLRQIIRQKWDVVIHLAALPRVGFSVEQPLISNDVNVTRTLMLLDACRGNVDRVVFASSSSVYGGAEQLPTPETAPRNPRSPYALQKAVIEDYLRLWNDLYDMDSACLRFFNVYGPNQLGGSPYSIAISAWLTAIKRGLPMRSDGDGTQTRDLCYVDNVTDACVRAAKHSGRLNADTFNIACGDRTSNNEVMDVLRHRYPGATKVDAPWRPGDVMHTHADIEKASKILGYRPLVKIHEGLERTIKWYDDNFSWAGNLVVNV